MFYVHESAAMLDAPRFRTIMPRDIAVGMTLLYPTPNRSKHSMQDEDGSVNNAELIEVKRVDKYTPLSPTCSIRGVHVNRDQCIDPMFPVRVLA